MENTLNLPWKAERYTNSWVVRDNKDDVVFIPQTRDLEKSKELCLVVCVAMNNSFPYMTKD